MIPDMTTGMSDFMIRSGLNVPTPAIPIPDFAVPYAAPIHPKVIAKQMPDIPMNGANFGVNSDSAMMRSSSARERQDRWTLWRMFSEVVIDGDKTSSISNPELEQNALAVHVMRAI